MTKVPFSELTDLNLRIPPSMIERLEQFDQFATSLVAEAEKPLSARLRRRAYHYTDERGLRGILGNGTLWATDVFNLNDPSEILHGIDAVKFVLSKNRQQSGAHLLEKYLDFLLSEGVIQKMVRNYVCSFSTLKDDLSQWRSYANNGKGFVLEFDTATLVKAFVSSAELPAQESLAMRVNYSEQTLMRLQCRLLDLMPVLIIKPNDLGMDLEAYGEYLQIFYSHLAERLVRLAMVFKHHSYKREQEFRLLKICRNDETPKTKERWRGSKSVSYCEFRWRTEGKNPLKAITIGPAANTQRSASMLTNLLNELALDTVEIRKSTIPFRAL